MSHVSKHVYWVCKYCDNQFIRKDYAREHKCCYSCARECKVVVDHSIKDPPIPDYQDSCKKWRKRKDE